MKKIYFILIGLIIFSACRDESLDPRPDLEDHVGAVTLVQVDPDNNFFNALNADLASEDVIFTVDVNGFQVTEVESVDIELVYTEKDGAVDPFIGIVDSVYAPVNLGNITEFPSQVTLTASDVAAAIGRPVDSLEVGDSFLVTFPVNTADGRRLTVALASDVCNQPAQPSFGGCSVGWAVACPSQIPTGTWTTAVTPDPGGCNTVQSAGSTPTITSLGAGLYEISNFDYGYFGNCCGNIRAQFQDVCNELTLTGTTEFGIQWMGTGTYVPDGGPDGNGQIIFSCHYDLTFGGSSATDSIVLNF